LIKCIASFNLWNLSRLDGQGLPDGTSLSASPLPTPRKTL
jgi:hypothetical protein